MASIRGKDEIGTYLALTGEQINGADAIQAGLADFFVPTASLSTITQRLSARQQRERMR